MGARPVGYPAILALFGTGATLVHVQTWFSVGSWALLGWVIGRIPGVVVACFLAYSSPVRLWNAIALTESMTLSLAVLLIALSSFLARSWRWSVFVLWACGAALFGLLRDANVIFLPFFALPLAFCGRRRLLLAALVVAVVVGGAGWHAQHEVRWKIGYQTAIRTRVLFNRNARDEFFAAGMPRHPFRANRREFLEWLGGPGRSVNTSWVLRQPASYWAPWEYFFRGGPALGRPNRDLIEHLDDKYFGELVRYRTGAVSTAVDAMFRWLAPPVAVGLLFAVVPLIEWRLRGSVGLNSLWVGLLTASIFVHGFAAYNLSGSGHARHILLSSVLYRIVPFALLAAVLDIWRSAKVR